MRARGRLAALTVTICVAAGTAHMHIESARAQPAAVGFEQRLADLKRKGVADELEKLGKEAAGAGEHALAAEAYFAASSAWLRRGDVSNATTAAGSALFSQDRDRVDAVGKARRASALAAIAALKGNEAQALEQWRRSLSALGGVPSPQDELHARDGVSRAELALGNVERAKRDARHAVTLADDHLARKDPLRALTRETLGDALLAGTEHTAARERFAEAVEIRRLQPGRTAALGRALLGKGIAEVREGRATDAASSLAEAQSILRDQLGDGALETRAAQLALATAHARAGDAGAALRALEHASTCAEADYLLYVEAGGAVRERAAIALRHDHAARWYAYLVDQAGGSYEAREALRLALLHKAQALTYATNRSYLVHRHAGPQTARAYDALREVVRAIQRAIDEGASADDIGALKQKRDALFKQIRPCIAALPDAHYIRACGQIVADVQAVLAKRRAALLEIVIANDCGASGPCNGERYVALLATGTETYAYEIGPRRDIDALATRLVELVSGDMAFTTPARKLAEHLLKPTLRDVVAGVDELIIAPEGSFTLVPFGVLPWKQGTLADDTALTLSYVTAGRDLVRTHLPPSDAPPIVFAAPSFGAKLGDTSPRATRRRDRALDRLTLTPLPYALDEGRAVRDKLSGAALREGDGATETAFLDVAGPRVLHVATHGLFAGQEVAASAVDDNSMDASALFFAGAAKPPFACDHCPGGDGIVTAREAAAMDLWGTELVVLSACDSARGTVANGEWLYGLQRAFVVAGAKNLITSLWSIDDRMAERVMRALYDNLATMTLPEALRTAIDQLRQGGPAKYGRPKYWASLRATGIDSVTLGPTTQPTTSHRPTACTP